MREAAVYGKFYSHLSSSCRGKGKKGCEVEGVNPLDASCWPECSSFFSPLFATRPYTDRKKKIIREWTKSSAPATSTSPSAAAAAAAVAESAARSAAAAAYGTDFLYPAPYIKEEAALAAARGAVDYTYGHHHHYAAVAYQVGRDLCGQACMALVKDALAHPAYAAHHLNAGGVAAAVSVAATNSPIVHEGKPRGRKKKSAAAAAAAAAAATSGSSNGPGSVGGNSNNGMHQGLTRDERKAVAMSLPITCSEIINLPMDEFNDLLSKHDLSEEQLTLCRDIRRRGKNKVRGS